MSDQPLPFHFDDIAFEKRSEEFLRDAVHTYLDDDKLINKLPNVIKKTLFEAYKYHADRAAQIDFVYKLLFPEDRVDDV